MKKYFSAIIDWIGVEEGGRKRVPNEGTKYSPLIRINNGSYYEDWSIVFICPDFSNKNIINFCFLVDIAPSYLIKKNEKYEILEGNKKVAKIEVIDIWAEEK